MSTFLAVKKHGRRFMLGLIVVTGVVSFLWFRHVQSPGDTAKPLPGQPATKSLAQMTTRDFRHVETRMNRTVWILEAAVAEVFEKKARLQRVKITYFGEQDKPVIITGRRGMVDLETWNAVLFDTIRARGPEGEVLKTHRLEWNQDRQLLMAPLPVRLRSKSLDISGVRMAADLKRNHIRIEGRVNTVIRPVRGVFEPLI